MAYVKNKNSKRRSLAHSAHSSHDLHKSRARGTLLPASPAGKLTLGIIILVMLVVIFSGAFAFLASPSRLSKNELRELAASYYENYFYDNVQNPDGLDRYSEIGLARLSLRQLLLSADESKPSTKNLEKYCDENATYVKFYPKPPYKKSDYEVEYIYSCNF